MPTGVPSDPSRRCTMVRVKDGKRQRCKKTAAVGVTVCERHGAQLPAVARKSRTAKAVGALHALITPIPEDDWEANPANALLMDVRRCIAAIRYYDEKIEFLEEDELIWGEAAREHTSGFDAKGPVSTTTRRYEAQLSKYLVARQDERKHLLALTKVWISARLDEKRIEIEEQTVYALNGVIVNILRAVGKDVNDPEIRRVVRDQLLSLPGVSAAKVIEG